LISKTCALTKSCRSVALSIEDCVRLSPSGGGGENTGLTSEAECLCVGSRAEASITGTKTSGWGSASDCVAWEMAPSGCGSRGMSVETASAEGVRGVS
jgi:hypothetical protein